MHVSNNSLSARDLKMMANAGVEYMAKAKALGFKSRPTGLLSWDSLADFVAIKRGKW